MPQAACPFRPASSAPTCARLAVDTVRCVWWKLSTLCSQGMPQWASMRRVVASCRAGQGRAGQGRGRAVQGQILMPDVHQISAGSCQLSAGIHLPCPALLPALPHLAPHEITVTGRCQLSTQYVLPALP